MSGLNVDRSLNRIFCRWFNIEFAIPSTHDHLDVTPHRRLILGNQDSCFSRHKLASPNKSQNGKNSITCSPHAPLSYAPSTG